MAHRAAFAPKGALLLHPQAWGEEFLVVLGGQPKRPPFTLEGGAAVIDVTGPLMQHDHFLFDSYDAIRERARLALEEKPKALVLRVDSPGGEAAGCFELSRELRGMAAKAGVELVAFTDTMACSAAYALACSASSIVVTSTGQVGSIGVFEMMLDQTAADRAMGLTYRPQASGKRKMDKNPHVQITDDAEAEVLSKVEQMASLFFGLVAEMRPISVAKVRQLEGSVQFGTQSVGTGLADQVSTWSALIARIGGDASQGASSMSKFDEAYGAMKRAAEGDDEDAKRAKRCLKAWDEGDKKEKEEAEGKKAEAEGKKKGEAEGKRAEGEEEPKKEKEEAEGKKAEAEGKKKGEAEGKRAEGEEEPKKEKEEEGSKGLATRALAMVHTLQAKLDAKEEDDERAKLLASRPDFAPELVALLSDGPLSALRKAVATLPKNPSRMAARASAQTVGATRGATQTGEGGGALADPDTVDYIAKKMGGSAAGTGIVRAKGGHELELGFMSPGDVADYERKRTGGAAAEGK